MSCLVYCIFRGEKRKPIRQVTGVGAKPVFVVTSDGLGAAVSRVLPGETTPNVSRLLAYENVIQRFHAARTVIPFRYGCVFDEENQIVRLLGERAGEWKDVLRELDGRVEMGIRALSGDKGPRPQGAEAMQSHVALEVAPEPSKRTRQSGREYLSARKACYMEQERIAQQGNAVLQRCREALAGLSVKSKMESPSWCVLPSLAVRMGARRKRALCPGPSPAPPRGRGQANELSVNAASCPALAGLPARGLRPGEATSPTNVPLPSLYFLIRRRDVASFRQAFRKIRARESASLLLSGPWPPYNFVERTMSGKGFRLEARSPGIVVEADTPPRIVGKPARWASARDAHATPQAKLEPRKRGTPP